MATREKVFLAVFDDELPEEWNVWGDPFKVYVKDVSDLDIQVIEELDEYDKYRFDLILDTPEKLMQRSADEMMRIVGVVVDPVDFEKYPEKASNIERRFTRLCKKLAVGSVGRETEALHRQVGFHIIIAATENTLRSIYERWYGWLSVNASVHLKHYVKPPQTVIDKHLFFVDLRQRVHDMALSYWKYTVDR